MRNTTDGQRWFLGFMLLMVAGIACCETDPFDDPDQPRVDSWALVDTGYQHTCGVQKDGLVWCWGSNEQAQLGIGDLENRDRPRRVFLDGAAVDVSSGYAHSCAVLTNGAVYCWGNNDSGQIGDGTRTIRLGPTLVEVPVGAVSVSAGHAHTCAVDSAGGGWCWGRNDQGQLGIGNMAGPDTCGADPEYSCALTPHRVALLEGVGTISAGGDAEAAHSCAYLDDYSGWCWGNNGDRQLGDDSLISRNTPVEIDGLFDVRSVAVGARHSCATLGEKTAYCWGVDYGNPFWISGIEDVETVTTGTGFSCSILTDRTAWCWGEGSLGQLGNGNTVDIVYPEQVVGILGVERVSAGGMHACAVTDSGQLWCWGNNDHGQLGGSGSLTSSLPMRVMN